MASGVEYISSVKSIKSDKTLAYTRSLEYIANMSLNIKLLAQ